MHSYQNVSFTKNHSLEHVVGAGFVPIVARPHTDTILQIRYISE